MGHGGGIRFDGLFYMGLRFGVNYYYYYYYYLFFIFLCVVGGCGFVVVVVVEVGFDMM